MLRVILLEEVLMFQTFIEPSASSLPETGPARQRLH